MKNYHKTDVSTGGDAGVQVNKFEQVSSFGQ